MTFRPKASDRKAPACAVICFAAAVFSFYFSSRVSHAALLYQVAAIILAVVALEVYLKYIASDYVYEASAKELKVYKITGNKSVCVCSLSYEESLSGVVTSDYFEKNKAKFPKTQISLNYCKNIFPKEFSLYFFSFNGKKACLKFEPDEIFTNDMNKKITAEKSRLEKQENEDNNDE